MQTYASTTDMSREEWLEARRNGIGGSDAAAIMGANPWRGPLAVYADKLGLSEEKETSEAARQGTDLEEYVARRFCEVTGKSVRKCNRILRAEDHPFMLANVDRMIVGERAGLECKTINPYAKYDFENGEVPLTYQWQCQHYMAVTGYSVWYLAVMVLGKGFYVYRIERDEALIEALIDAETAFWTEHVQKHVPPYATATEGDEEALSAVYTDTVDDTLELVNSAQTLDMLALYKNDKKTAEANIKRLEDMLKSEMGAYERGSCGKWRTTWKNQNTTRVDSKKLEKEYPDAYKACSYTTTSRVLRIKEVKTNE